MIYSPPSDTLLLTQYFNVVVVVAVIGTLGVRHLVILMMFLRSLSIFSMRVNLSVALVAMVNTSHRTYINISDAELCNKPNNDSYLSKVHSGKVNIFNKYP